MERLVGLFHADIGTFCSNFSPGEADFSRKQPAPAWHDNRLLGFSLAPEGFRRSKDRVDAFARSDAQAIRDS